MLSTIWTWTQEWSDIPSRSDCTWAMCHQARTSASALTPSSSASSRRLPRVGARTAAASIASAGAAPELAGTGRRLLRHGLSRGSATARNHRTPRPPEPGPRRPDALFRRRTVYAAGVASSGAGKPSCPETGLAVPECSCKRCLEAMLREFSPHPAGRRDHGHRPHNAEDPARRKRPRWPSGRLDLRSERRPAAGHEPRSGSTIGAVPNLLSIERHGEVAARHPAPAREAQRALDRAADRARRRVRGALGRRRGRLRRAHRRRRAFCSGMDTTQFGGDLANRERLVRDEHARLRGGRRLPPPGGRRGQRPRARRRLRALAALRPADRLRTRRPSATRSCPAGSRPATRPPGRCSRRPSPRSSA